MSLLSAAAWVVGSVLVARLPARELALSVTPVAVALALPGVAIAIAAP